MKIPSVMVIFGTRPEAIKMAPVVRQLAARPDKFRLTVCVTAQHRQMLDQVLQTLDIRPDIDLNLMLPEQTLPALTARIIEAMDGVFRANPVDCILVHGDPTTAMAASLSAFYHRIKIGHVEAGLRTDNKYHPFPEEINRRLTAQMTDFHFAPTQQAAKNLEREGISSQYIFVTGNTVIDALLMACEKVKSIQVDWHGIFPEALGERKMIAITGHRRENLGEGFLAICAAIRRLAIMHPQVEFIYPVHLNPQVRRPVFSILSELPNVYLIEPLDYLPFVALMQRSSFVLTDSGGLQEEAPSLGKPVLVMRETTERPEAVEAGTVKLVGTDEEKIVEETNRLLTDPVAYARMSQSRNPYGDGTAAARIVEHLESLL